MKSLEQRIADAVKEEITIAPYNTAWKRLFESEARNLWEIVPNSLIIRIEHFGSTSVPGLAAKPIVDILVEVKSSQESKLRIAPLLQRKGYDYFWRTDMSPPYAWFIKRNAEGQRSHHIHMMEKDLEFWQALYFRDYLKEHKNCALRYEELKRSLAEKFPNNREAYTHGKTEFVARITKEAIQFYCVD